METGREKLHPLALKFPLIVKPNAEGSSKGISRGLASSTTRPALRAVVRELIERYRQPALVEEYISGREFTVGLLGDRRPRVLPPMEILLQGHDERSGRSTTSRSSRSGRSTSATSARRS